jgi:predicted nucleotidyltransferase
MFQRGRQIEPALLTSRPETPRLAIVQPCTTVFNLAAMGDATTPPIQTTLAVFNQMLSPWNVASDYVPEEMVLDGKAALEEYAVLVLPNAVYMTADFAARLDAWTRQGGLLIAIGPFALADPYGEALPAAISPLQQLLPAGKRTGPGGWDYDAGKDAPAIIAHDYGKGRILFVTRKVGDVLREANAVEELKSAIFGSAAPWAHTADRDLQLLVREAGLKTRYLCLCNRNVEKPVEAAVTVGGQIARAVDVVTPDGFPVPVGADGSSVSVHLEPGDFTLIRIDLR